MALPLRYHWQNLFVRRTTALLTVLVISAVVATLAWLLGFGDALRSALAVACDERKLIVLKRGATAESTSAIPVEEYNRLNQLTSLARDPTSDAPLLSPEMVVQVAVPRLRDGGRTLANVAVRGVTPVALAVHASVRLEGPLFATGAQEVIVGRKAAAQFQGLGIGERVNLGYGNDRGFRVVGYFTADSGPLESEIWGYLPALMNAYNRTMYSSACLRLRPDADARRVVEEIAGPAIEMQAQTEAAYWRSQALSIQVYMGIVAALVLIMAAGAVLSVANMMFATVAGRTREIAMLRTIGYSRGAILAGFVLEAVLLALAGGVLGCGACAAWLALAGDTKDMYGATSFSTLAFEIRLTPPILALTLALVAGVGAAGALVPAWRAARLPVVAALREA